MTDFPRCGHLVTVWTFKIYDTLPAHVSLRTYILHIFVTPSVPHLENKSLRITIERPWKPNIYLYHVEKPTFQGIPWQWNPNLVIL